MTEILEPKLRALGPDSQQPGMSSVARAAGPMLTVSALITIVAGVRLAFKLQFFDRFPGSSCR